MISIYYSPIQYLASKGAKTRIPLNHLFSIKKKWQCTIWRFKSKHSRKQWTNIAISPLSMVNWHRLNFRSLFSSMCKKQLLCLLQILWHSSWRGIPGHETSNETERFNLHISCQLLHILLWFQSNWKLLLNPFQPKEHFCKKHHVQENRYLILCHFNIVICNL